MARDKKKHAATNTRWVKQNREKSRIYHRRWVEKNKARHLEMQRVYHRRKTAELKSEMIAAYGGKCSCCGECEPRFLTLEHVNGDGASHRDAVGNGEAVWRDLKKRGWPSDGFMVFCWNCNAATSGGKKCPHAELMVPGVS